MNRRILLVLAVLVTLGGVVGWTVVGGGRRDPEALWPTEGGTGDAPTESSIAISPAAGFVIDAALSNRGRDPRPTSGSGSIVARVVRASDGLALAGVRVLLEGLSAGGGRVSRPLWSDVRGDVRFDDVEPGSAYGVHVQRDPNPPVDRLGVAVTSGETTDLGRIALEAVGVVDVLVLDESRTPVKDASVSVSFVTEAVAQLDANVWPLETELPGGFAKGTTDDRGRLRIEGVPPGPIAVRATSPGFRGRTVRSSVPAEPPKTAFVAFVLAPGTSYGGRVVSSNGSPIEGALVEFGFDTFEQFEVKASTKSIDDGTFQLRGFERLEGFELRVSAAGYATVIASAVAPAVAGRERDRSRPVDSRPIEVVLDKSATLAVAVLDAKSRVPVPNARLRCVVAAEDPRRDRPTVRLTYEGRSDALGIAAIPFPARRAIDLEIVADDHRTFSTRHQGRSVQTTGGQLIGDLVSAPAVGERREVTALLVKGFALWGVVSTYTDPSNPIPGALVEFRHGEHKEFDTRAGTDATFERGDVFLPDRSPRLLVSAPGFYPVVWETFSSPDVNGLVKAGVKLQAIERNLSITGTVVDGDRKPVAGALVRISDRGLAALSKSDGSFRFDDVPRRIDPRVAGPLAVSLVAAKGRLRVEASLAVPRPIDGNEVAFGMLTIEVEAEIVGVALVGKLADRARYPLVDLVNVGTGAVVNTFVGGEFGDFTFVDVVAGEYRVRARDATRGGGRAVTVRLGSARPTFLDVRMVDATFCAGRLEDHQGEPIAGYRVELELSDPPENQGDASLTERYGFTDAGGGFRFRCFGAVPQTLRGSSSGRRRDRIWNERVEAGEKNVVRLRYGDYDAKAPR